MFSTHAEDVKMGSGKFFPIAADNKDVLLTKIEWVKTKGGNGIAFYWQMGALELKDIIFDKNINSQHLYPKVGESTADALKRFHRETGNKVRHIMSMYMPQSELDNLKKASSLEDYCSIIIDALKPRKIKEYPLYLKTIANKAGFATIPPNAIDDFVQLMSSGPCKLAYSDYELKMNAKNAYVPGVKQVANDAPAQEQHHEEAAANVAAPEDQIPISNDEWPPASHPAQNTANSEDTVPW